MRNINRIFASTAISKENTTWFCSLQLFGLVQITSHQIVKMQHCIAGNTEWLLNVSTNAFSQWMSIQAIYDLISSNFFGFWTSSKCESIWTSLNFKWHFRKRRTVICKRIDNVIMLTKQRVQSLKFHLEKIWTSSKWSNFGLVQNVAISNFQTILVHFNC